MVDGRASMIHLGGCYMEYLSTWIILGIKGSMVVIHALIGNLFLEMPS